MFPVSCVCSQRCDAAESCMIPNTYIFPLLFADGGFVTQHLRRRHSSIASELKKFSFYGHICAMKGLLQALPAAILTAPLSVPLSVPASDLITDTLLSPQSAQQAHDSSKASQAADIGTEASSQLQTEDKADNMRHATPNDPTWANTQHHSPAAGSNSSHTISIDLPSSTSTSQARSQTQGTAQVQPATNQKVAVQTDQPQIPHAQQSSKQSAVAASWSLLSDGALPACCAAVHASTDAHHKFHSVSALAFCLDRIKQCLQVSTPCDQ